MSTTLDEEYLTWLYAQIGSLKLKNPSRTHWLLARQLYKKEFVWFIPNDDNRIEDGRDLRYEFLEFRGIEERDEEWLGLGCSMLEMLIAISRRIAFEADGDPRDWFWHLLENVDLRRFNDRIYDELVEEEVDEILDRIILRLYARNGRGGLFPLRKAEKDQREVELWYQLSAYLSELLL